MGPQEGGQQVVRPGPQSQGTEVGCVAFMLSQGRAGKRIFLLSVLVIKYMCRCTQLYSISECTYLTVFLCLSHLSRVCWTHALASRDRNSQRHSPACLPFPQGWALHWGVCAPVAGGPHSLLPADQYFPKIKNIEMK